jgi:flavin reductase (DIM6/NTAB) family NADH-FMN oxidoreductase RutF
MIDVPARFCHRLLAPRTGYLIGTSGANGPDVTPISNVTQVSADPQIFVIAVYRKWQTYRNLQEAAGFTLSVPRVEHANIVWRLGQRFSGFAVPEGETKLEASGGSFDHAASGFGPVLVDATGWCECEVMTQLDVPEADHGLFLGRVLRGAFNEKYMRSDGMYVQNSEPLMQVVLNRFATSTSHWEIPWLGPDHP